VSRSVAPIDRLGAFVVGPALLQKGRPGGPLSGKSFAVKDLFDVQGTRTGAGNPDWLAGARAASRNAPAVAALIDAGADLYGKTVTDELAFSLSGTNVHYGTPVNSAAPGRVPGGSSSGSAAAVAGGAVDIALGTDTAGSVRVPASYCGIFGLRPTHGRVDVRGVVPLAPSFDTVGALAADAASLASAWRALDERARSRGALPLPRRVGRLLIATDLLALADDQARCALAKAAAGMGAVLGMEVSEHPLGGTGDIERWRDAFRAVQMVEVWEIHGRWISQRRPRFGPGIAERFAAASHADRLAAERARPVRAEVLRRLEDLLGDDAILVQPTASGPAPPPQLPAEAKQDLRARTFALTSPAGMAGAPALSLPAASVDGLPVGMTILGLPGDDEVLVQIAQQSSLPVGLRTLERNRKHPASGRQ